VAAHLGTAEFHRAGVEVDIFPGQGDGLAHARASPDHEAGQVHLLSVILVVGQQQLDLLAVERVGLFGIRQTHGDAFGRIVRGLVAGAVKGEDLAQVAHDLAHRLVVQLRHEGFLHPGLQVKVVDLVGLVLAPGRADVILGLALVGAEARRGQLVALDVEPEVNVVARVLVFTLGESGKWRA